MPEDVPAYSHFNTRAISTHFRTTLLCRDAAFNIVWITVNSVFLRSRDFYKIESLGGSKKEVNSRNRNKKNHKLFTKISLSYSNQWQISWQIFFIIPFIPLSNIKNNICLHKSFLLIRLIKSMFCNV